MRKYGKSYGDIAEIKKDFLLDNAEYLGENMRMAEIYKKQPKRKECKLCGGVLEDSKDFLSHGIQYKICGRCGHINGAYQETADFTRSLYEESDYGKNYHVETLQMYKERMKKIYIPKARFLKEVFEEEGINWKEQKCLDVGAGSGYFIGAMKEEGFEARGIEISLKQTEYGNKMLEGNYIAQTDETLIAECISTAEESIISFIGVLEHMRNLDEILCEISRNNNIRYIYFSVPMLSYSVMWEATHDTVFNLTLGGSHTHIFSNSSLEYLYKQYGWKILGEWFFGTDAADLFRSIMVIMQNSGNTYLAELFRQQYNKILDDIQIIMDKNHFCSEVHVLVKKNNIF